MQLRNVRHEQNAQVGDGDYLTVTNPIGANGGGANTNVYTLLMDIKSPGVAWNSLVDIDGDVFSGDGEVFTRSDGRIGIDGRITGQVGFITAVNIHDINIINTVFCQYFTNMVVRNP